MKQVVPFISLIIGLGLVGCQLTKPPSATAVHPGISVEPPSVSAVHPSISVEPPTPPTDLQPVADAALYRGVITSIQTGNNSEAIFILEQAEGTNFGYPVLEVVLAKSTKTTPEETNFIEGMYVEVQYGAPAGGQIQEPVTAISVKRLMSVEGLVFNGEILSLHPGDKPGSGSIMLRRIGSEADDWYYRYDADTSFYLNFDELKIGEKINVFTNGITNPSFPPQASALEVRPYYAG